MKNEISVIKKEKENFSVNFFMNQLGEISEELREKVTSSVMSFIEFYTQEINYRIIDDEDARNLFNNIQYLMSLYAYKNDDVDAKEEILDSFSYIKKSYKFYKSEIANLKKAIDNLFKINPLNKLPEVAVYLERLRITVKAYENLISSNLETQQIEFMPLTYKGKDYPFFKLVDNIENGFLGFYDVISSIEAQFEFFGLFKESDIIRIYKNLNCDVLENGQEYKYTDVLRPVLQQYLFCSKYSKKPTSLRLEEDDVKNIGVDMKIFFTKEEKEEKYYILPDEEYAEVMNIINTSDASEFYRDKLYNCASVFNHIEEIRSDNCRVVRVSILDNIISKLKGSRGFEKNQDISYEIITILTRKITTVLYEEDAIDDEYMDMLIMKLKSDEGFKSLTTATQEYILKNVPDVRHELLSFKKMKNIAFLV